MSKTAARSLLISAAVFGLTPTAAAEAAPVKAQRPVARDWTRTVVRTPAGAYVIGNPAAKVKLIEYLSLTCPHCAHFAAEGYPPLEATYIRTGKVSLEVRHAIRDPFDMTATLLARCAGPAPFLGAIRISFATQGDWIGKAQDYAQAHADELEKLPAAAQFTALGANSGLDAAYAARGVPVARQKACLANPAEIKTLTAMAEEAWATRKIHGTPSFLVNGVAAESQISWAELELVIQAALR
jgi:protein-disulfide isomerase